MTPAERDEKERGMYRTLMALALALLFASAASAQQAAGMRRPKRYDPARPPYYYDYHDEQHGYGRHHRHHRRSLRDVPEGHHDRDTHLDIPKRHDERGDREGIRSGTPASGARAPQPLGQRGNRSLSVP